MKHRLAGGEQIIRGSRLLQMHASQQLLSPGSKLSRGLRRSVRDKVHDLVQAPPRGKDFTHRVLMASRE